MRHDASNGLFFTLILMVSPLGFAEGDAMSSESLAKELANPNSSLGVLSFQLDQVQYRGSLPGADRQDATRLSFQPSLPYKLSPSLNLFVRPLVPIYIKQPMLAGAEEGGVQFEDSDVELGDISFDASVGKSFKSGVITVGGIVGTLPTATEERLSKDQYLLGPEFLLGYVNPKFVIGALLSHQVRVAGDNKEDTKITGGQYFYTINLKNAWQIQGTPTWTYDHEAPSGNALTFPVGIGLTKTTTIGKTPWKFSLQYWYYIEQADDFGPQSQIRFSFSPVVSLPW